jgi:NAD-dependent SIR2 family protein deacetylase
LTEQIVHHLILDLRDFLGGVTDARCIYCKCPVVDVVSVVVHATRTDYWLQVELCPLCGKRFVWYGEPLD